MKKSILTFLTVIITLHCFSQKNYCSETKRNSIQRKAVVPSSVTTLENKYDVKFYHLDIDVERTNKYVIGNVRTIAKVIASALDTFAFELHSNYTIDSIKLAGNLLTYSRIGAAVYVNLPNTLFQNQTIDAKVYYKGGAPSSGASAIGDGLNSKSSPQWGNRVTWSLSESYVAYEWWPCKQQLRDKIDSSYCFITTDNTNKAGSNGVLTAVVSLPNNKSRYEWKSRHPIDYYLISVAVAQYMDYSIYAHPVGADSILVQNYIYNNPAVLTAFQSSIDETTTLIELFSEKFGLYYFSDEKYGHCMAPLGGGMEHQTMTTIGFFNFTLIAHELGHQWFGDNVTCKTWSDIFVNESFASYTEYIALENLYPAQKEQHMLDVHNYVMSQPDGSIWFTDTNNVGRIFDSRLSYDKGSAMLHMLRYEINNDSIFFLALKNYQAQYSDDVATALDFKAVVENVSGQNFTTFFQQWFYGEGYPTFNIKYQQVGSLLRIQNTEVASMPSVTPFFKTHIDYLIHRNIADTLIRLEQNQQIQLNEFNIAGIVTSIEVDKDNWVLNQLNPITIDNTLGIKEINNSTIKIYPNPSNSLVTIQTIDKLKSISLFKLNGDLVFDCKGVQTIDVSTIANGIYYFSIETVSGEILKQKFVKNK